MSEISFLRDNSAASLGIEDLDDVMEIKFDYEVTGPSTPPDPKPCRPNEAKPRQA